MELEKLLDTSPADWPASASTMIREVIEDRTADAAERLFAAKLAGAFAILDNDLSLALLAVVGSDQESDELRCWAASSLGSVLQFVDEGLDVDLDLGSGDTPPITRASCQRIQEVLHYVFHDPQATSKLRRAVLHASVRAPQDWHGPALHNAYAHEELAWRRTAVSCMRFIRGFDAEILESLESEDLPTHHAAICAAGKWSIDAAWSHMAELIQAPDTRKPLLLAALDAVATIRPREVPLLVAECTNSIDQNIVEAALDAIAAARACLGKG